MFALQFYGLNYYFGNMKYVYINRTSFFKDQETYLRILGVCRQLDKSNFQTGAK